MPSLVCVHVHTLSHAPACAYNLPQVFSLLSVGSFVSIVTQLVGGVSVEGVDIQRKVIEMFNSRLENGKLKLQREHVRRRV